MSQTYFRSCAELSQAKSYCQPSPERLQFDFVLYCRNISQQKSPKLSGNTSNDLSSISLNPSLAAFFLRSFIVVLLSISSLFYVPVFLFEMFTFGSILFIKKKIISRHAQARLDTTDSFYKQQNSRARPCRAVRHDYISRAARPEFRFKAVLSCGLIYMNDFGSPQLIK